MNTWEGTWTKLDRRSPHWVVLVQSQYGLEPQSGQRIEEPKAGDLCVVTTKAKKKKTVVLDHWIKCVDCPETSMWRPVVTRFDAWAYTEAGVE